MDPTRRHFINKLPDYTEGSGSDSLNKKLLIQRVLDHVKDITTKWEKKNADCGLYNGMGGAAYALERLSHVPQLAHEKEYLMQLTKEMLLIINDPRANCKVEVTSPFLGNCGSHAVSAVIQKELGNVEESKMYLGKFTCLADYMMPVHWEEFSGDEFMNGRAGYLTIIHWLRSKLHEEIFDKADTHYLLNSTFESGEEYAKDHSSGMPLMYRFYQNEYLGATFGMVGILTILLCFPDWLDTYPPYKEAIQKSVDALLALQQPNGNFPATTAEIGVSQDQKENELIHWCQGAPGFVYLMAKAYMVYGDQKYLDSALKCGEVTWEKGLLTKGPGICHGIAGSGYVFLILYRVTKNPKHLHRAIQFYNFMYTEEFKQARTPDHPYSLFEGVAGTICFMTDILNPDQTHFPFFDIY